MFVFMGRIKGREGNRAASCVTSARNETEGKIEEGGCLSWKEDCVELREEEGRGEALLCCG